MWTVAVNSSNNSRTRCFSHEHENCMLYYCHVMHVFLWDRQNKNKVFPLRKLISNLQLGHMLYFCHVMFILFFLTDKTKTVKCSLLNELHSIPYVNETINLKLHSKKVLLRNLQNAGLTGFIQKSKISFYFIIIYFNM